MANYLDLNGTTDVVGRLKGKINEKASNADVQLVVDELALKANKTELKVFENKQLIEIDESNCIILNPYEVNDLTTAELYDITKSNVIGGQKFAVKLSDLTENYEDFKLLHISNDIVYADIYLSYNSETNTLTVKSVMSDEGYNYLGNFMVLNNYFNITQSYSRDYTVEDSEEYVSITMRVIQIPTADNKWTAPKAYKYTGAPNFKKVSLIVNNTEYHSFVSDVTYGADFISFENLSGEITRIPFSKINGKYVIAEEQEIKTGDANYRAEVEMSELPNGKGIIIDVSDNVDMVLKEGQTHVVTSEEAEHKWFFKENNRTFQQVYFCNFAIGLTYDNSNTISVSWGDLSTIGAKAYRADNDSLIGTTFSNANIGNLYLKFDANSEIPLDYGGGIEDFLYCKSLVNGFYAVRDGVKHALAFEENHYTKTEIDSKGYLTSYTETDPTVPSHVKAITEADIAKWNEGGGSGGSKNYLYNKSVADLNNENGVITDLKTSKDVYLQIVDNKTITADEASKKYKADVEGKEDNTYVFEGSVGEDYYSCFVSISIDSGEYSVEIWGNSMGEDPIKAYDSATDEQLTSGTYNPNTTYFKFTAGTKCDSVSGDMKNIFYTNEEVVEDGTYVVEDGVASKVATKGYVDTIVGNINNALVALIGV